MEVVSTRCLAMRAMRAMRSSTRLQQVSQSSRDDARDVFAQERRHNGDRTPTQKKIWTQD